MLFLLLLALLPILFVYLILKYRDKYDLVLFCPKVRPANGGKLEDFVKISNPGNLFGNTFDLLNLDIEYFFKYARDCRDLYKASYLLHFPFLTAYNVITPEDFENIIKVPTLITKGRYYDFLQPFLGTGLLTSTDAKWHSRRKLLTPTFHFNILEQFLDTFKRESKKFQKTIQANEGNVISLNKVIPRSSLNMICETALGVKLDQITTSDDYRKNIKLVEITQLVRAKSVHLWNDFVYNMSSVKKLHQKHCDDVHTFTEGIVNKRRIEFQNSKSTGVMSAGKKRYAMLDMLLTAEQDGQIDHKGICEEVDTLTFEGYDTTSAGLMFTMMMIALHEDVQQKCYEEIREVIDSDARLDDLTVLDYNKFKYLECVIKESLRLYPPVPYISRTVQQDSVVGHLLLPKSTQISIHIFDIHRDPRHFPDPEKFDPERFTQENSEDRHPFAFIPFSAGLRNCIGQKFAMLEMKTLLIFVLSKYRLLPVTTREDLKFEAGLIIRTKNDIEVKFVERILD